MCLSPNPCASGKVSCSKTETDQTALVIWFVFLRISVSLPRRDQQKFTRCREGNRPKSLYVYPWGTHNGFRLINSPNVLTANTHSGAALNETHTLTPFIFFLIHNHVQSSRCQDLLRDINVHDIQAISSNTFWSIIFLTRLTIRTETTVRCLLRKVSSETFRRVAHNGHDDCC